MLRPLRPALLSLVAASLLGGLQAPPNAMAQGAAATANGSSALSVEQARAAAIRVLEAVKNGDANARFAQFTPEMQAVTSPSMIAATLRSQPKVLGYELLSVRSGMSGSTVEAEIKTKAGSRVVFMVLSPQGRIERYYIDRADDSTSNVALQFVQAVSTGNFITAQSFLSPSVQQELTPAILQSKWLELQRETGTFTTVGRAVEAESTADIRLVLVNVQFTRLSDNLYVILNSENQITGVDFPESPAGPKPVR
ncbi:MAG: hypothetical protein RLZZ186_1708 [Cyanobacteriota bacterium]